MGQPRPLFVYFRSFQTNITIFYPVIPEPLTKKFCNFWSGLFLPVSLTKWRLGQVRFDRSKLNAIAKAKKVFVSETGFRFCAIDWQISFLALALASKKLSKTVSETRAKWLHLAQSVKLGVQHQVYLQRSSVNREISPLMQNFNKVLAIS